MISRRGGMSCRGVLGHFGKFGQPGIIAMGLPRSVNIVKDKPEHGYVHFTNLHLATLQNKFGPDWLMSTPDKCNRCDMEFLKESLLVAGVKDKSVGIKLEDIDEGIPLSDVAASVLDAIFIASFGMDFAQRQIWVAEQIKKMDDKDQTSPQ